MFYEKSKKKDIKSQHFPPGKGISRHTHTCSPALSPPASYYKAEWRRGMAAFVPVCQCVCQARWLESDRIHQPTHMITQNYSSVIFLFFVCIHKWHGMWCNAAEHCFSFCVFRLSYRLRVRVKLETSLGRFCVLSELHEPKAPETDINPLFIALKSSASQWKIIVCSYWPDWWMMNIGLSLTWMLRTVSHLSCWLTHHSWEKYPSVCAFVYYDR